MGSPCIDTGKNADWMGAAVDLDGNDRIIDGDEDGSYLVDIGAYEHRFVMRIVEVAVTAGGGIQLNWSSRPGESYVVSVCSDLATWQWITVATVPSQGFTTSWADSALPANRRMFYRIDLE